MPPAVCAIIAEQQDDPVQPLGRRWSSLVAHFLPLEAPQDVPNFANHEALATEENSSEGGQLVTKREAGIAKRQNRGAPPQSWKEKNKQTISNFASLRARLRNDASSLFRPRKATSKVKRATRRITKTHRFSLPHVKRRPFSSLRGGFRLQHRRKPC